LDLKVPKKLGGATGTWRRTSGRQSIWLGEMNRADDIGRS
jgi:hypothetical protein